MSDTTAGSLGQLLGRHGSTGGFTVSAGTIDVFVCRLDVGSSEVARLEQLLAPEELERARRFLVHQRRCDFIAGRGLLRELLGLILGFRPSAVPLAVEASGKLALAASGGRQVRFNVAHSMGLGLYCVTLDHDVGVDVERVDDHVNWEEIAARSFAPAEQRSLTALPREARRSGFFDCWTRKEAVIKATGEGLRRPLSSFVVSVEADRAAMLSCEPELGAPESWFLAPVPVPATHRAAVAVRGGDASTTLRVWG